MINFSHVHKSASSAKPSDMREMRPNDSTQAVVILAIHARVVLRGSGLVRSRYVMALCARALRALLIASACES
jgi:hypothetical protein